MDVSIFRPKIEAILKSANLDTISAKKVRQQLQAELGLDLSAHKVSRSVFASCHMHGAKLVKDILNGLIRDCFEQFTQDSIPDVKPKVEPAERPLIPPRTVQAGIKQKVKHEIKTEATVRHSDEDADARYARELQAQYSAPRASRSAGNGTTPKRKRTVKKRKKTETMINSDGETVEVEAKKRKVTNNGFNKLLTLSDELSELLGGIKYLSRPQVAKHIWGYIKGEGLQDQGDKRYINCDDKLSDLLGVNKVHMFTMTKLLQKHMRVRSMTKRFRSRLMILG